MLRSVVSLCDHRIHALDEYRRAFDQRDGERRPLIQVCGTDVDTVPAIGAPNQHSCGVLLEIKGQVDLLRVGHSTPMKIQIAADLNLESLPGAANISMCRDADVGAVRFVGWAGGCRLPAPEAVVPAGDRDVPAFASDIGTVLMAPEFVAREIAISPVIHPATTSNTVGGHASRLTPTCTRSPPGPRYLVTAGAVMDGVRFWRAP